MARIFTEAWLAERVRKQAQRIGSPVTRPELARQWNGNVQPTTLREAQREQSRKSAAFAKTIIAGAPTRKDGVRDAHAPRAVTPAPSKFRNVKTDGYASKKEAKRASELKLLHKAGLIRELREQVRYEIIPKQDGGRDCAYVADFVYQRPVKVADHLGAANLQWETIIEDTKGHRDAQYIIKRKLMLHVHGIRISEV